MSNQNIDSRANLLNDAELEVTRGGRDLMAADDPTFIQAGPEDAPRPANKPYTEAQLKWLRKWFSHIR